jgi:DNA-binding MarR family transcriptional regulator
MRVQSLKKQALNGVPVVARKPRAGGNASEAARARDTQLALSSDLSYDIMTSLAGFWIRRAQLVVMKSFDRHFSDLHLRPVEAAALILIGKNQDISQNVLATALGTDQATMVAISTRLEDQNLISRRRLVADRRYQVLNLTSEGKKTAAVVKKRLTVHNENVLKNLSATRRKQLVSFLQAIVQR